MCVACEFCLLSECKEWTRGLVHGGRAACEGPEAILTRTCLRFLIQRREPRERFLPNMRNELRAKNNEFSNLRAGMMVKQIQGSED